MAMGEKHRKPMAGLRYGHWTIIYRCSDRNKVFCKCDCGTERALYIHKLQQGKTTRCSKCTPRLHSVSHGMSGTRLYGIYRGIMRRCYNKTDAAYPDYGGRGIVVSDEWRNDFLRFASDMGERPSGATVERIDNDGPYSADNCKWATRKEQCNNTRRNINLTWNGRTQTVAQWCDELGVSQVMILKRLKRGWSAADALNTRPKKSKYSFREAA